MKIAVAFVLVALSCFVEYSSANSFTVSHEELPIPIDCLQKLVTVDLPNVLTRLHNLLCLYAEAQEAHNEELFKAFLRELHITLTDLGCGVDQILNLEEFLEKVGDKAGEVAEKLLLEILKLADKLEVLQPVTNLACQLTGELLKSLSDILSQLNLDVSGTLGGVKKILEVIG